jgi:hypothetical protein
MAGAGKKTFTAGEVLTASDTNTYLMEQTVMVFGGTAARSSAIPTPSEGMVSYRTDIDIVETYNGSSWIGLGGYLTYGRTRQLAGNNGFTNQTSFGDMTNADDKTALDMSIVKKQDSSVLLVNYHFPVWLFSGAAQNFYGAINIGGTDYAVAGNYITAASSTGFMSGTRIISGINAGTYATKPRFASGGASTFIAAALSYVSYSVQELPQ